MNKRMMQKVLGKGLVIAMLVAIAAVSLCKVESVLADEETIRVGQTVKGWIPQGDREVLYRLASSAQTLVHITATRTDGNLQPQLNVISHDGNNYQVAAYDLNYGGSDTASVDVMLPPTSSGYWIKVTSVGDTSGVFSLSTRLGSAWHQQETEEPYNGYKVTFSIDRIVCRNPQDGDNLDELELVYSMQQHTPYGTAVDINKNKVDDMWMQGGWEFNNFVPLTRYVGKEDAVSLEIELTEEDEGWNGDETLAKGTNTVSAQELKQVANGSKVAPVYWPVGNGQYQYEIYYSIYVEKI